VPYHIESLQQRFGRTTLASQRRDFHWQGPLAPATRNSSLNRPEVHGANPRPNMPGMDARPNPRRPGEERNGRPDGRNGFSANPAVVRSVEARPEFRGPVSRPPMAFAAAAPQVHSSPGNVPRWQSRAPQPVAPAMPRYMPQAHGFAGNGYMPQTHGFAGHGQAGNLHAPSAAGAHGNGHGR